MTTDELMIGNYVFNTELGKIDIITDIEENRVGLKNAILPYTPISLIRPEPINEEWLLQFGFERDNDDDLEINIEDYWFAWDDEIMYIASDYGYPLTWIGIDRVKYVHQLQNLCFLLTNKKLS